MDGTLAALFFVVGLADMGVNHCPAGCLAPGAATPRASLALGDVIFQEEAIGQEAYGRFEIGRAYGPFQPAAGLSLSDDGDAWAGFGATWTGHFAAGRGYLQLSFLPGVHLRGRGPEIGPPLSFRSGVELGYQAQAGWRIGVAFDHRSNGDIDSVNPGLETLQIRVSVPLN